MLGRREFLELGLAGAIAGGIDKGRARPEELPKRQLGRTGEHVSMIGLGGAHIGRVKDEAESLRIVRAAVDGGITFLDNSWDYNDGASEERMGRALGDGYRG